MDFKNTIIILTSNIGSQELLDGIGDNGEIADSAKEAVFAQLKAYFRPELLNRLDEIIFFKPLTKENLYGIIDIMMEELVARLGEKGIQLRISDSAKSLAIERGYDPVYGARPLKRYLQSTAQTLIAKEILGGDIGLGSTLVIDAADGELVCKTG